MSGELTDLNWTNYVSVATGIVGAITGISGGIMAWISYRRVNKIKAQDLRIEVKKDENSYRDSIKSFSGLLDKANKSRQDVASATGKFKSGMMVSWEEEVNADKETLEALTNNAPDERSDYSNLSADELEFKIIELHKSQLIISNLVEKYKASISEDDDTRKHLREQMYKSVKV